MVSSREKQRSGRGSKANAVEDGSGSDDADGGGRKRRQQKQQHRRRHKSPQSVRSKADSIVEDLLRDVAALGAPFNEDDLAASVSSPEPDVKPQQQHKRKKKHKKQKEEEKEKDASPERKKKKSSKDKDKDKSRKSKKKKRKHKSDYGPAPDVPVKAEPKSDNDSVTGREGVHDDDEEDKKDVLSAVDGAPSQFSGVLDTPDGPSLADIEFVVPSSAITDADDSQRASTFVPLSQRFGKAKSKAKDDDRPAKGAASPAAGNKKFTLDAEDIQISVASDEKEKASEPVVTRPKIVVKAQKLSDFMRQRGHEVADRSADDDDASTADASEAAMKKSSSESNLLPAPPAPPPRSAMQLEPFPLSKQQQQRPRIPILKGAGGGGEKPSFVPRNVSLKQKADAANSGSASPSQPAGKGDEEAAMTVANKSREKMRAQVEEAKARLAGVFDFDDQFKPPERKKKRPMPRLSDDESEASVAIGKKPVLPSKEEQKQRKTQIVIQSVKKSETLAKAPAAVAPARPDEEGEIVEQDEQDDDDDKSDLDAAAEDTEGELKDDSDDDRRSMASSLALPARKNKVDRLKKRRSDSVRRSSKKEEVKKRRDRSPTPTRKSNRDRDGRSVSRRARSRSRSRSRSRTRLSSRRSRSRSRSRRRSRSRSRTRFRADGAIDYRRRRVPQPSERDKQMWPWGKGADALRLRRFSRSPPVPPRNWKSERGESISPVRERSRSKSKSKRRSRSKSKTESKRRSRSKSKSKRRSRSREATPTPRDDEGRIDKKKLFEIARKNASAMLQMGTLQQMRNMSADEIARLKSGGRSVDELVEYCKKLSRREQKELLRQAGETVSSDDESVKSNAEMDEEELVNHPFAVKAPTGIRINIPNAIPLPTKTPFQRKQEEATLRLTFPVSSGQQHRVKEVEWMPVQKVPVLSDKVARSASGEQLALTAPPAAPTVGTFAAPAAVTAMAAPAPVTSAAAGTGANPGVGPLPLAPDSLASMAAAAGSAPNIGPQKSQVMPVSAPSSSHLSMLPPPPAPPPTGLSAINAQVSDTDKVFSDASEPEMSVNEIVSRRVRAMRQLQDNPHDVEALKVMHHCEQQMKQWAQSKNLPGQFTGSTGASILSADQLRPSDPKYEAWAKKDMLARAAPVEGGFGMSMLLKLGWRPGEGLGREKSGQVEPLLLDIKSDRKGLVAVDELPGSRNRPGASFAQTIVGKHPVSVLTELCQRRRWGPPQFAVMESGPTHARRYLWKVIVNSVEYQPAVPSNNKKAGKTQAATVVLQSLGLIPKDSNLPVVIG